MGWIRVPTCYAPDDPNTRCVPGPWPGAGVLLPTAWSKGDLRAQSKQVYTGAQGGQRSGTRSLAYIPTPNQAVHSEFYPLVLTFE